MAAVSTRANEAGTALRTIFFGLLDDVASTRRLPIWR